MKIFDFEPWDTIFSHFDDQTDLYFQIMIEIKNFASKFLHFCSEIRGQNSRVWVTFQEFHIIKYLQKWTTVTCSFPKDLDMTSETHALSSEHFCGKGSYAIRGLHCCFFLQSSDMKYLTDFCVESILNLLLTTTCLCCVEMQVCGR